MGDSSAPAPRSATATATAEPPVPATRAVRSRRTVATPTDDFEDLLGEFVADAKVDNAEKTATSSESVSTEAPTQTAGEKPASRQYNQPRPERQPRDFSNDSSNRSRRNRRNRNGSGNGNGNAGGRERFNGDSMANADQPYNGELVDVEGLLDLRDDGYGFLRTKSYHSSPNDVYVSINQVRRYHLRKGDTIVGGFRPAASNEKYPALLRVDTVAGVDPEVARLRPRFEDLTPLFPDEKLKLETNAGKTDLTPRIVDLLSPIGKGQRGLIVSPPKAGKTTIMKQIAQSIEANNPRGAPHGVARRRATRRSHRHSSQCRG